MSSSNFPINKNYYETQNFSLKNIYKNSNSPININNRSNKTINIKYINFNNDYSKINLSSNKKISKHKIFNIISLSNWKKNIKNDYKNLNTNPINHDTKSYTNCLNPSIILNKCMSTYSLGKKIDFDSFYYNDNNTILKKKILQKLNNTIKGKKLVVDANKYEDDNNTMSLRTIKHPSYIRKPLVIKFEKDININNIYNNSNIYNSNNITNVISEKIEYNKAYTERRAKHYVFSDIIEKPELFRNLEDLEKKSLEISKRKKMKKNFSNKYLFDIKKDNNLIDIRLSLDAIRRASINKMNKTSREPKEKYSVKNNKIIYAKTNKNNTINNIKKLFIVKNNNNNYKTISNDKMGINEASLLKKIYIEDTIPENVLTLSIDKTKTNKNLSLSNKKNKFIEKILPSISEEDDKIKSNIINLVNILQKIIGNKNIHKKRDSMNKLIKENKINKNNSYNKAKHISNFIYSKKIIQKNNNKSIKGNNNKFINNNITNSMKANKDYKNKFGIIKLIEFSLKNNYS